MGMWTVPDDVEVSSKFSSEELDEFINTLAKLVVDKHMSAPAVMTLEMIKPLSLLGQSALMIFGPLIDMIFDPVKMEKFQAVIGDRKRIEQLMTAIEDFELNKKETKEGVSSEQE